MANEKLRRVFFRFENINSKNGKVIDTKKCLAVGFINIGNASAFLNRNFPIPDYTPATGWSPIFFPINENEKDATRYEVSFRPTVVGARFNCLVIYKEAYDVDFLPAYEK